MALCADTESWKAPSIVQGCGVPAEVTAAHARALETAYAQPHRAYHTLAHLQHMFALLDEIPLREPATEWATWFHDYVYRPGRGDNEAASATRASATLLELGLCPLAPRVAQLIEAKRGHQTDPGDLTALLFLDADLAILGAPAGVYCRYAAAVAQEHHAIPSFLYVRGRRAFLRTMLARPRIFATDHFRTRFEQRARENMTEELDVLNQQ